MKNILDGNGEIALLSDDQKIVCLNSLEDWQVDQLTVTVKDDAYSDRGSCLQAVDRVVNEWLKSLTEEQWLKIARQNSLFGIPLPQNWIKAWRVILKEPNLRDTERATKGGRSVGTYTHLWNIWAEDCIDRYLDDLDKELLWMVDQDYLYAEIGEILLSKYGDEFWKKRKENSKTTPQQVVNNYLYNKLPTKIARGELTDICRCRLRTIGVIV